MTERAEGTFIVTLTPVAGGNAANAGLGRMAIDKAFHGDLEATSTGEAVTRTGSTTAGRSAVPGLLRALRPVCI